VTSICGEIKVYKTNPHTLKELRNNTHQEISATSGEELHTDLTPSCSADTLGAFSQDGSIFSICCSTGKILLHFLKVILTVTAHHQAKATFTNSFPAQMQQVRARLPLFNQTGSGPYPVLKLRKGFSTISKNLSSKLLQWSVMTFPFLA
jgi:hypothetical protein